MVTVTPEATRADIAATLAELNARAKRMLRRDALGRENEDWAALHGKIDKALSVWEAAG